MSEGSQEELMSQNQPEIQYAAFLAIDWADQKHVWSLQDANSGTCERGEVAICRRPLRPGSRR